MFTDKAKILIKSGKGGDGHVSFRRELYVAVLLVEAGETYTFDQVLAVSDSELKVGSPMVEGATVEASVVENGKLKKVIVYKYKRKTGYHKKNGHRQQYTAVKINKINA